MKIESESLFRQHGKWYAALRWKDEGGKWRRKTKACKGKTKALAKIELQEWRREVEAEQVASSPQTLGQLVEEWLEVERAAGNIERSTISGYGTNCQYSRSSDKPCHRSGLGHRADRYWLFSRDNKKDRGSRLSRHGACRGQWRW